ncbi:MAG: PA14 domain-containing protein [Chloroflexia bacterium]
MFTPTPDPTGANEYKDDPDSPALEVRTEGSALKTEQPGEPQSSVLSPRSSPARWEAPFVYLVTLAVLALIAPRLLTYLSPLTGDEPFYAMTAISIWNDGDLNECNNYHQADYAKLYPSTVSQNMVWPFGWQGWTGAPYPLPPHAAKIEPDGRRCTWDQAAGTKDHDSRVASGSHDELYSKHGVGLAALITLPYALGDRLMVVFLLNILGALVAVNIYLLARQGTGKLWPAMLTWVAFSFTVPLMPYSFLIFPELPAALLVIYAFRRIWLGNNNRLQLLLIALCLAFLPWLHYRFLPLTVALFLYYLYRAGLLRSAYYILRKRRRLEGSTIEGGDARNAQYAILAGSRARGLGIILTPLVASGLLLMGYFYFLYGQPWPNLADHAGTSDLAGTVRGVAGSLIDEQWGLFVAAPIYILAIVGVVLMLTRREWRGDLLWIGIVFVPYLGVVANYAQWWGEWCPPARYLTSILPLLALPFARSLSNIRGVIYKAIFGVLLALSLGVVAGFVYQPKWMYNQPTGEAQLFLQGVPALINALPADLRPNLDLVAAFPSFVVPYFGYLIQGKASGDYWSAQAWDKSLWPFATVFLIVFIGLVLAWLSAYTGRRTRRTVQGSPSTSEDGGEHKPHDGRWPGPSADDRPRTADDGSSEPASVPPSPIGQRPPSAEGAEPRPLEMPLSLAPAVGAITLSTHFLGFPLPGRRAGSEPQSSAPIPSMYGTGYGSSEGAPGAGHAASGSPGPAEEAPTEASVAGPEPPSEEHARVEHPATATNGHADPSLLASAESPVLTEEWPEGTQPSTLGPQHSGVGAPPAPPPRPRRRGRVRRAIPIFWRARGFWLALVAVGLALYGQQFLVKQVEIVPSIRYYALGIVLLIVAWWGTYKNKSFLLSPVQPAVVTTLPSRARQQVRRASRLSPRLSPRMSRALRYGLALVALGLNIYAVWGQLRFDFSSAIGGWGWLVSVVLLLVAFLGYRTKLGSDADAGIHDVEDRTDLRLARKVEIAIIVAIFLLAMAIRLYRLDDWTTGMHGDEGEAGEDAMSLLEGNPASPFGTGWFAQPNFYYWAIAICIKIFGPGMLGLRMFVLLAGSLMVLPVYGLARLWFGLRAAILAGVFLAISDVAIHFSRQEFSNITTPFFLTTGFFLFFRALRNKRMAEFVLAGYAFMLSMYFYLGGRLTPFMVAAVIIYLFLFMPLMRLPGVYKQARLRMPGARRLAALRSALSFQARGVYQYLAHIMVLAVACFCFAGPFLAYYLVNRDILDSRTQEKLIANNQQRMVDQYQINHDPLYIGLRLPTPNDIYPVLPVVFEQTPLSVKLTNDGFWARAYWRQTTTTLSILTYTFDASSVYTFTNEPIAKPIEAALIILGIAWALWRWRDTRMAVLSIWFWSTIFVGGVLTIDAPYVARIVGIFPVMALFAAITLNKLTAEFVQFIGQARVHIRKWYAPRLARQVAQVAGGLVLLSLLIYLGVLNFYDYYTRYLNPYPFPEVTGTAYFVRQMNTEVLSEGRPLPRYYDVGAHFIYWAHGTNRYLSHGTPGDDMVNPTQDLPVVDNQGRDVVFMVWGNNVHYLPVIKAYYPDGEEGKFDFSKDGSSGNLFTYYRVKKEQLDARRFNVATYTPATGPARQQPEYTFGTQSPPPAGITYPAQATWTGGLVAPAFANYQFRLAARGASALTIDGTEVVSTTTAGGQTDASIVLARGPHDVTLTGNLANGSDAVSLTWSSGGSPFAAIARKYLWYGPGRGLAGEIRQFANDPLAEPPPDVPGGSQPPVIQRRVDGFLGFEAATNALAGGGSVVADWRGDLIITDTGKYTFDVHSNGGSVLLIDGNVVVDNRDASGDGKVGHGEVDLTTGAHHLEVRYNWSGGTGYLEVFWTPPGQQRAILGPEALHAAGGAWRPGTVTDAPGFQFADDAGAVEQLTPERVVGNPGDLLSPRGVAVDDSGNVYVGDRGHNRIVTYSPEGRVLRTWGTAPPKEREAKPGKGEFTHIADVAVHGNEVYVLDVQGIVQVFNDQGEWQRSYDGQSLGFFSPNGLSVGSDGAVYIADTGMSRLVKLSSTDPSVPPQNFDGTIGADGQPQTYGKIEQALDVALGPADATGNVYGIDLKNRLLQFAPDGRLLKSWPVQIGGMDGGSRLAANPDASRLYLSDPDRARFAVIDPAQGLVTYHGEAGDGPGQFRTPSGIAVDKDGLVYIVDSTKNNVQVFKLEK